jgi:xanthine phosphoribosyltransferase
MKIFYRWEDFDRDCRELAEIIKINKVEYTKIIAVTRGGLFVAGMMSHFLKRVPIDTVCLSSYDGDNQGKMNILKRNGSDEKVLICDDVVDTGNTAKELREMYPNGKLVVLHYKSLKSPGVKPDYFISDTNDWIVYPWEVGEDVL